MASILSLPYELKYEHESDGSMRPVLIFQILLIFCTPYVTSLSIYELKLLNQDIFWILIIMIVVMINLSLPELCQDDME